MHLNMYLMPSYCALESYGLKKKCSVREYISHNIRQIKFIHVHTVSFNETAMELKYVCFDGCMKMRTSSKL